MGYSKEVYESAMAELGARRKAAADSAQALRLRMLRAVPRVGELEQQMAAQAGKIAHVILQGGDYERALKEVEEENRRSQEELAFLLHQAGEQADNFEPVYTCVQCEDTGYIGSRMCDCLQKLLSELAGRKLSEQSGMKLTSFDTLDLGYYSAQPGAGGKSPRQQMTEVIAYARSFGEDFWPGTNSLLLFGPTGTGKTHVALAIAGLVVMRGYSVIYGPVQQLLSRVEKEHFGRAEGDSLSAMTECDLLILDDLGTELSGSFYSATLYHLINSRMLAGRPTVISTNLFPADIHNRYGEQIASRILGTYQSLLFAGSDIRQIKMHRTYGDPFTPGN